MSSVPTVSFDPRERECPRTPPTCFVSPAELFDKGAVAPEHAVPTQYLNAAPLLNARLTNDIPLKLPAPCYNPQLNAFSQKFIENNSNCNLAQPLFSANEFASSDTLVNHNSPKQTFLSLPNESFPSCTSTDDDIQSAPWHIKLRRAVFAATENIIDKVLPSRRGPRDDLSLPLHTGQSSFNPSGQVNSGTPADYVFSSRPMRLARKEGDANV